MADPRNERQNIDRLFNRFQTVLDSDDYQQLAASINDSVNQAIDRSKQSIKRGEYQLRKNIKAAQTQYKHIFPGASKSERKTVLAPVAKTPSGTFSGPFLAVGSIFCIVPGLINIVHMLISGLTAVPAVISGLLLLVGGFAAVKARSLMNRVSRFKQYLKTIDLSQSSIRLSALSEVTGKKIKYLRSDLAAMIELKMFPEGHLSADGNVLLLTNAAHRQYLESLEQEKIQKAEAEKKAAYERAHPELQEVFAAVAQGKALVNEIRSAACEIDDIGIQSKIDKIISATEKILDDVQRYPEHGPEIRRFIQYYLPMTLKVIHAYHEFSSQPIQSEDIQRNLGEIENTLDTIAAAYENLYTQLFKARTVDIASDLSVMKTMLARDGLA